MKIVGGISILLLLIVTLLQALELSRTRRMKLEAFQEKVSWAWDKAVNDFLDSEYLRVGYTFSCGMEDQHTFSWKGKRATLSAPQEFYFMLRQVVYDHLYENRFLNLHRLDSVYRARLLEGGVSDIPALYVKNEAGEIVVSGGALPLHGNVVTRPVKVGYECKHTVCAVFPRPPFFRSVFGMLIFEAIFLAGFIGCLLWQLRIMKNRLWTAKVQTTSIVHLEHELRKPLAVLINQARDKMLEDTPEDKKSWELQYARLLKISDVTEMMLFALKEGSLKIERTPLDIRQELETAAGTFRLLKKGVKVDYQVEEGIDKPVLDTVYFGCMLANLIDNGLKYNCRPNPEVHVYFGKEPGNWILRVRDNGIGIPEKELKHIFDRFYRIADKRMFAKTGFGLGLTFIKQIVDVYGGQIEVNSCPEEGSEFMIKIPSEI